MKHLGVIVRIWGTAIAIITSFCMASFAGQPGAAFQVAVVTSSAAQGEDAYQGAESLIGQYGAAEQGGRVRHLAYADSPIGREAGLATQLVDLAGDSRVYAIVLPAAIRGTSAAFARVRAKRPDILLLAGAGHEDPQELAKSADLVVAWDFISRLHQVLWSARQLGAKSFVYLVSPAMEKDRLDRRRIVLEAACRDLGLRLGIERVQADKDPAGYYAGRVPGWLAKYGPGGAMVAFYCAFDDPSQPLEQQLRTRANGILLETRVGFSGSIGLDLSKEAGDRQAILKKVEAAIQAQGAPSIPKWPGGYGYAFSAGLGTFALRAADGTVRGNDLDGLRAALDAYTPGARWSARFAPGAATGHHPFRLALVNQFMAVIGSAGGGNLFAQPAPPVPDHLLGLRTP